MNIIDKPLSWYISKLKNNEYFSLGMMGDGEFQCIFNKYGDGFKGNCEGTLYGKELTEKMNKSMEFCSPNFYFSAPDTFIKVPYYRRYAEVIDKIFPNMEFYEKNMWNKVMCEGELYPLISELRKHDVYIVGNKMLRGLTFLNYKDFFEVSYPNCFPELKDVTDRIIKGQKPGVYIFACGIPATLFVQACHGKIKDSWFIDTGSIWDGFVGIGGQRPTRREFYLHPEMWMAWVNSNLKDIEWPRIIPRVNWHGMGSLEINPNL